jgi:hypothetical protein
MGRGFRDEAACLFVERLEQRGLELLEGLLLLQVPGDAGSVLLALDRGGVESKRFRLGKEFVVLTRRMTYKVLELLWSCESSS